MSSKSKLTKADLKRIEDLNKKVTAQKTENAKEKVRLKKMAKDIEAEKKKLAGQWKELKNARKQAQNDKDFKVKVAQNEMAKNARGPANGPQVKKLQEELLAMKTKFNHEGKRARQFKQEVDQLRAENNVLQKKLKNLLARRSKGEDPRIKHLIRENKMLKKQMRLLMIELNKKRRWFQRCIKSFKSSRQKWVKQQEDTLKKSGVLIKHVFMDDIKQMKLYKDKKGGKKGKRGRFKNRIKVKARDGGMIVLRDVDIVVLDDDDDSDSGPSSKPRKSRGDLLDDTEALMAQIQRELEEEQAALGGDDLKENDSDDEFDIDGDGMGDLDGDLTLKQLAKAAAETMSDDEADSGAEDDVGGRKRSASRAKTDDYGLPMSDSISGSDQMALQAQLVYLRKELDDRTDDVEKIKEIMSDAASHPDPQAEVKKLLEQIGQRGEGLLEKMENEVNAEEADVDEMKSKNDQWVGWLGNLSMAMAKNGALFYQLLGVYEFYLKELKGRVGDLETVNNSFYTDKGATAQSEEKESGDDGFEVGFHSRDRTGSTFFDEDEDGAPDNAKEKDKESEWATLKNTVSARHVEVEGQFKNMPGSGGDDASEEAGADYGGNTEQAALDANAEKVKAIRDSLVANNGDWRAMIDTVSTDYDSFSTVKREMKDRLATSAVEMKVLLDLVIKIPKRKILTQIAGANPDDEQPQERAENQAEEQPSQV